MFLMLVFFFEKCICLWLSFQQLRFQKQFYFSIPESLFFYFPVKFWFYISRKFITQISQIF